MVYNHNNFRKVSNLICYPFGHKGKKYTGQKTEIIKCPECKKDYEVTVVACKDDSEWIGYCHAMEPNKCPYCDQKFWYREGLEK